MDEKALTSSESAFHRIFGLMKMGLISLIIDSLTNAFQRLHIMAKKFDDTINGYSPFVLIADTHQNNVYKLKDMLQQSARAEFLAAMEKEINGHLDRERWIMIRRDEMKPGIKTIWDIWSFKNNLRPDGAILK